MHLSACLLLQWCTGRLASGWPAVCAYFLLFLAFGFGCRRIYCQRCSECKLPGGTLVCHMPECKSKYHFGCVLKSNARFLSNKRILCANCVRELIHKYESSSNQIVFGQLRQQQVITHFPTSRKLNIIPSQKDVKKIPEYNIECINRFGNLNIIDIVPSKSDTNIFDSYIFVRTVRAASLSAQKFVLCQLTCRNGTVNGIIDADSFSQIFNKFRLETLSAPGRESGTRSTDIFDCEVFKQQLLEEGLIHNAQETEIENLRAIYGLLARQLLTHSSLLDASNLATWIVDFIGYCIPTVREWIKYQEDSLYIQKTLVYSQKIKSLSEFFYKEEVEHMHPFDKQKKIEKVHQMIMHEQGANKALKSDRALPHLIHLKQEQEAPLVASFSAEKKAENKTFMKRSDTDLSQTQGALKVQDLLEEVFPDKYSQATKEREQFRKIRQEYNQWIQNKKRHTQLYVAPSMIHKYGLFSRQG